MLLREICNENTALPLQIFNDKTQQLCSIKSVQKYNDIQLFLIEENCKVNIVDSFSSDYSLLENKRMKIVRVLNNATATLFGDKIFPFAIFLDGLGIERVLYLDPKFDRRFPNHVNFDYIKNLEENPNVDPL